MIDMIDSYIPAMLEQVCEWRDILASFTVILPQRAKRLHLQCLCAYIMSFNMSIWNILFMDPRMKMIVNLNILWSEFVETMRCFDLLLQVIDNQCVTKICRSRSKRRIVSTNSFQSKLKFTTSMYVLHVSRVEL